MTQHQIVHVSSSYPPSLGGMEKVASVLVTLQAAAGHQIRVLTSNQGSHNASGKPDSMIDITRLKSFVAANTIIMPGLLRKLLQLSSRSVVHLHVTQAYTPELVWFGSKLKKYQYIAHIHIDVPSSSRIGWLLIPYKRYILRRVLQDARYVVVFTKKQQLDYIKRYNLVKDQVKIIANGAEEVYYYGKSRTLSKPPRLLFVGRLDFQKNISQLLQALDGISSEFVTTLVGEGDMKQELIDFASSLRLNNVVFAGRADGQALVNFYKQADIFVLPSEREGMPLVLLEAMAMRLPVIATEVDGSRDIVRHDKTGWLVPYNDALAFRHALVRLAGDVSTYKRMSAAAGKEAEKYSWHSVNDHFLKLYDEVD